MHANVMNLRLVFELPGLWMALFRLLVHGEDCRASELRRLVRLEENGVIREEIRKLLRIASNRRGNIGTMQATDSCGDGWTFLRDQYRRATQW